MDKPLVSVVTPSCNSMPYIEDTIKSVLNQNYNYLEHIIIDGGSTDGTVELLKSFNHLVWVSEKDSGQSQALNKGFKKAKGEIIGWLNSDDTYTPGAIGKAVDYLVDNPDIDLVFTDINIIDEEGNVIGLSRGDDFNLKRLLTYNMVKQPSLFMKRRVIDELSGLNEELHYVMDQEFWLRAGISKFGFRYLKNSLFANFRLMQGTKSFESSTSFSIEWQRVLEKYLSNPCFDFIELSEKNRIKNQSLSTIYINKMLQALEENRRFQSLKSLIMALKIRPALFLNRGIWKFLLFIFIGLGYNRVYRYQKQLMQ